jgi:hypothetical protein
MIYDDIWWYMMIYGSNTFSEGAWKPRVGWLLHVTVNLTVRLIRHHQQLSLRTSIIHTFSTEWCAKKNPLTKFQILHVAYHQFMSCKWRQVYAEYMVDIYIILYIYTIFSDLTSSSPYMMVYVYNMGEWNGPLNLSSWWRICDRNSSRSGTKCSCRKRHDFETWTGGETLENFRLGTSEARLF